jgi:hypothetical protein
MTIPDSIMEQIRKGAKEEWPDDKDMQTYTVKEEIESYRTFENIDYSGISEIEKKQIIQNEKESFESWGIFASSVEDEVKALKEIKNLNYPDIESQVLNKWLSKAKKDNEYYYQGQIDYITSNVKQYYEIQETRKEIDPIKDLLIQLENIIGNECYNKNIQNYSSWGGLESKGRSFRYPVKFFNGESEYKKHDVKNDIPSEELITGYYPFGANELNIYRGLHKVLKYLEKNHKLELPIK